MITKFSARLNEDICVTHHKGLEIRIPPLRETIYDFSIVVDPVGSAELARAIGRIESNHLDVPPIHPCLALRTYG